MLETNSKKKSAQGRVGYKRVETARKRAKRRAKGRPVGGFLCAVIPSAALIGLLIYGIVTGLRLAQDVLPNRDTFQEGVSVNGVALTGYTKEGAAQMLAERYNTALTAQIILTFEDREWSFKPEDIGAKVDVTDQIEAAWMYGREGSAKERQTAIRALRENPVDLPVTLSYNRDALVGLVHEIKQAIDKQPVSATMQIVEIARFNFTDSETGWNLDEDKLVAQLEDVIRSGRSGMVEIQPDVVEPQVSRRQLEESTVLLGECYTSLETSSSARTSNVNLALSFFNFTTYEPGATIDFNRIVGKRTKKNGFKEAPEYDGNSVVEGIGGGTCQASTTLYGAAIRSGLRILERHAHTMRVSYVEAGQDAAVNDKDKNLRFKNSTDGTLYVFAYVDQKNNRAVCKMYGKPVRDDAYIMIESNVLEANIVSHSVTYLDDTDGKYVWFKDEAPVLKKEGQTGVRSSAYRVYYSLVTGEELERERLSKDYYQPENNTYWVGVHEREG